MSLLCHRARYKQGTFTRQFYGAVLTADVCGFTSLTERSAASKRGLETVEELMIAVNNYFNELIDTVHRHGGDVVQFAGDCMIVVFESEAAARLAGERLNALGSAGNGGRSGSLREGVPGGGENGARSDAEAETVEIVERAAACGFELISFMGIYTPLFECYGSVPLLDRESVDGVRRVCSPTATGGGAFVIRVLLVCVDTLQQVTLAKMLSKLSCQAYFASTRDAAVGLISQHAYHVVIVNEGGENASASAIIMAVRTSRHCRRAAVALLRSGPTETETDAASGPTDRAGGDGVPPPASKSDDRSVSARSGHAVVPRAFPHRKRGSCSRRQGRRADFTLTSPVTLTQLTTLLLNSTGFLQYFDSLGRNMLDTEALLRSSEKPLMSSLPSAGLEPGVNRRLRVLVVDDSPINRLSISHMLTRMDCEVELAGDGEEAVHRVRDDEPPYAFVMMDVQMARMDGCQATRLIRRLSDTRRAMVPIAAITSHTNSHRRCRDAGMDFMLPKPIKHEGVMQLLRSTVTDFSERVPVKVLVVDDNLVVLRQLSRLLEQLGCDVSKAANGFDALKIVQPDAEANADRGDGGVGNAGGEKNGDDDIKDKDDAVGRPPPKPFDIILIDLLMPGMSGMELAHRLRALSASGHNASLITPTTYMCAITGTAGNLSLCYDMGRGYPSSRELLPCAPMFFLYKYVKREASFLLAGRETHMRDPIPFVMVPYFIFLWAVVLVYISHPLPLPSKKKESKNQGRNCKCKECPPPSKRKQLRRSLMSIDG